MGNERVGHAGTPAWPDGLDAAVLLPQLLTATGYATLFVDAAGVIQAANPSFLELTGCPADQAVGRPLNALLQLAEGPDETAPLAALLAAEPGSRHHLCGLRPDGERYWVETEPHPLPGPEDGPQGLLLLCRDLSARHHIIETLNLHHEAISRHTIVSEADAAGRITFVNRMFEQISGYSRDELLGQDHRVLNSGHHPRRFWTDMFGALARDGVWHGEVCNRAKDGRLYWLAATNIAFRDAQGRISRYVSIRTDVTALKTVERRLQSIFRALADAVILLDESGRVIEHNQAACELLERGGEELRSLALDDLGLCGGGAALDAARLQHELSDGDSWRGMPCELRLSSGATRALAVHAEPVQVDGHASGAVLTLRDLSESRLQEERFALMVESAGLGTWDYEVATGEIDFNLLWHEMLGYEAHELDSGIEALSELVHPEDRQHFTIAMMDHLKDRAEEFREEVRLRRKDGAYLWLLLAGRVIQRSPQGRALRAMGIAMDVSRSKDLEAELVDALGELRRRAERDHLTQLPNREMLSRQLGRALERRRRVPEYNFAVLFFDFDRFKSVNDTLGHHAGDELLRQIATRLSHNLRGNDTVTRGQDGHMAARIGGDEFVVLLDGLQSSADAAKAADRLLQMLAEPYRLGEHEVCSTASIGIVTSDMEFSSVDELLSSADMAMYEAKTSGRGRHVSFDAGLRRQMQKRLNLESELRRALAGQEFELLFQPVVGLSSGHMEGAEACLSWHHPRKGLLPAEEFIPMAREIGLTPDIRDWVLRQLAREAQHWSRIDGKALPGGIGLQISRTQLLDPEFRARLESGLLSAFDCPDRILLQLSESDAMMDLGGTIAALERVRAIGVKTCLTRFGGGNSSIARLPSLPVDYIKLDPQLVRSATDERAVLAMLRAIIEFAHDLEKKVIAPGIDNLEQLVSLQSLECDLGQGLYIAPPMSAEDISSFTVTPGAL